MALDIRGGLKNTTASQNKYVAFEELLSNAIDSYLIRRNSESNPPKFTATLSIEFFSKDLHQTDYDLSISCTDNGAGFGDEQVKAFITKDSTYKDDLEIDGIGKCKGAGRIQFFHYFQKLEISSTFIQSGQVKCRTLNILENTKEIFKDSFKNQDITNNNIETKITLSGAKSPLLNLTSNSSTIAAEFSCEKVYQHIYTSFIQRLIILKSIIGEFSIFITESKNDDIKELIINSESIPMPTEKKDILLTCSHDNDSQIGNKKNYILKVTRYSLPRSVQTSR